MTMQLAARSSIFLVDYQIKYLLIYFIKILIGWSLNLINALKALADEKRLKIVEMLLSGNLCVGALAGHLKVSKPAVSQHIQVLRKAGLIKGEKRGYWTHYTVDRQALINLAQGLNRLAAMEKHLAVSCQRIMEIPDKNHKKEINMCENCCQQPVNLKDKPENCTPEQIRECHGDEQAHPCITNDCKGNCAPRDK